MDISDVFGIFNMLLAWFLYLTNKFQYNHQWIKSSNVLWTPLIKIIPWNVMQFQICYFWRRLLYFFRTYHNLLKINSFEDFFYRKLIFAKTYHIEVITTFSKSVLHRRLKISQKLGYFWPIYVQNVSKNICWIIILHTKLTWYHALTTECSEPYFKLFSAKFLHQSVVLRKFPFVYGMCRT